MTSAAKNTGIQELFQELGKMFLDPSYRLTKTKNIQECKPRGKSIKLGSSDEQKNKGKKFWC